MSLLLIGGTRDADEIARHLASAGRSVLRRRSPSGRDPESRDEELTDEVRIAGLLGRAGLRAVLDAGHPFDAGLSDRLWRMAQARGMPYLRYLRRPWVPGAHDRWTPVADEAAAVRLIPDGAGVFLATGRESLPAFAPLAARGARIWCRVLSEAADRFPFAQGGWLRGDPPFSRADEVALFRDKGIDWLVARNAGGAGNLSKFEAAAELGLPVAMIDQPVPPPGMEVTRDRDVALDWAKQWG